MDSSSEHIKQLRADFAKAELNEKDVLPSPFAQFDAWMKQAIAADVSEVQAMTISTANKAGKVSSRIVYLREFDEKGFCFYTNYNSNKGKAIEENAQVSLCIFWKELERQIRIEGSAQKVDAAQSDAYYNARPYASKIGAWASAQSTSLSSREELLSKIEELQKEFSPDTIIRPPFWGGYRVVPTAIEFWQGRPSRLHDRFLYSKNENATWKIERLSP